MRILISTLVLIFAISGIAFCQSGDLQMKVIEINRPDLESLREIVSHLKSSEGKIMVDGRTNSIVVIDHPENVRKIADLIAKLDAPEKQVEIKVTIADVTDNFLNEAGITSSGIIIPSGRFAAVLSLLDTEESSNIRTQMTVTTLSNQPAKIQATTEEVFGHSIIWYGHHHYVMTPVTVEAGDVLEVLPRVNNDGTILISLSPSRSAFQEDGTLSNQSILTQVVIKDGDTIAIGGLEGRESQTARQGTSFMGIPLSSRRAQGSNRVVMFLTATVTN